MITTTTTKSYSVSWISKIADIDESAWNALALPLKTPLLEWEWLRLLEDSGSVCLDAGWLPVHLTVWTNNRLVAAAPLYIKSHSDGEFVFDHAWADLAERLGVRYYPKLLGMSPFSPIIGYRFLIDPREDQLKITRLMVGAIDQFCQTNKISGCSFLFVDPNWKTSDISAGGIRVMHGKTEALRPLTIICLSSIPISAAIFAGNAGQPIGQGYRSGQLPGTRYRVISLR